MLRETLNKHMWFNLLQKRESRGDYPTPSLLVSWKTLVMWTPLHPLGGCSSDWLFLLWKMSFLYQDDWVDLCHVPHIFQQLTIFSLLFLLLHCNCRGFSCSLSHPSAAGGLWLSQSNLCVIKQCLCILPRSTYLCFHILFTLCLSFVRSTLFIHSGFLPPLLEFLHVGIDSFGA